MAHSSDIHQHYASGQRPSRLLGALCGIVRRWPPSWREHFGIKVLRALAMARGRGWVRSPAGELQLDFDLRDYFQAVMALAFYEPEVESLLERIVEPGAVYVDVGAQVGYTAALVARLAGPDGRLFLVEPDPRAFPRLGDAFERRAPSSFPRTTLIQAAASDHMARLSLGLSPVLGQSSISETPTTQNAASEQIEVSSFLLDDWFEEQRIERISLLKMDIEGHELMALKGMRRALAYRRAQYVLIEKAPVFLAQRGYTVHHLYSVFAQHGYRGIEVVSRDWITPDRIASGECENWLFAASVDQMRARIPGLAPPPDETMKPGEIEAYWKEVANPDAVVEECRQLLIAARSGRLDEAIERGLMLLADHPDQVIFHGHVAHWLRIRGRMDEARREYAKMKEKVPQDPGVDQALRELGG